MIKDYGTLLITLGFVGILILFLFRAWLGKWVGLWLRDRLGPRFSRTVRAISPSRMMWQNADGTYSGKCFSCKSPVTYSKRVLGEPAYRCEACGETFTWK